MVVQSYTLWRMIKQYFLRTKSTGAGTTVLPLSERLISADVPYNIIANPSSDPITSIPSRIEALIKQGDFEPPQQFDDIKEHKLLITLQECLDRLPTPSPLESESEEGRIRALLVVAAATFITLNSPAGLSVSYRFAARNQGDGGTASLQSRVDRAGLLREAGLKCAPLIGGPRTINCLAALRSAFEENVKERLDLVRSSRAPLSQVQIIRGGSKLCDSIYKPHTYALLEGVMTSQPDFGDYVIQHGYGGCFANPPLHPSSLKVHHRQPVVTRTLTSVLLITCLRAQGGVGPQLRSHILGLLKAPEAVPREGREVGVDEGQFKVEDWLASEDGVEWVIQTIDRLCAVHRSIP